MGKSKHYKTIVDTGVTDENGQPLTKTFTSRKEEKKFRDNQSGKRKHLATKKALNKKKETGLQEYYENNL